jgi:multiple sugar transport system permease protein
MTKTKTAKPGQLTFWERNKRSGGYLLQKKIMEVGVALARFILLFGMCFLILQPILNKISVSFMKEADLYNPVVISIPSEFTTENYQLAGRLRYY